MPITLIGIVAIIKSQLIYAVMNEQRSLLASSRVYRWAKVNLIKLNAASPLP
ncbi:MAG TPA: hypothetical protein V6D43_08535 [Candidatus Sericytochromatia bacterium]